MSDDVTHLGDVNNDFTAGQANYFAKKLSITKDGKVHEIAFLFISFAPMITWITIITENIIQSAENRRKNA